MAKDIKHPDKWETGKESILPTYEQNEEIRSLYVTNSTSGMKDDEEKGIKIKTITVSRTKTKAITKACLFHTKMQDGERIPCAGHMKVLAEYPREDLETLMDETQILADMIVEDEKKKDTLVKHRPIIVMPDIPKQLPREDIISIVQRAVPLDTELERDILEYLFGDEEFAKTLEIFGETDGEVTKKTKDHPRSNKENEEAVVDSELIKKFGKKKIEILAKEMGYKGIKINKKKK